MKDKMLAKCIGVLYLVSAFSFFVFLKTSDSTISIFGLLTLIYGIIVQFAYCDLQEEYHRFVLSGI